MPYETFSLRLEGCGHVLNVPIPFIALCDVFRVPAGDARCTGEGQMSEVRGTPTFLKPSDC